MPLRLRDVRESDLDPILALNNAAGPTILPLDAARLRFLFDQAGYFRVAEIDGRVAGFLVAMDQDTPYNSSNFLWFKQQLPEFFYIDRIVVASSYRGLGLGRVFYADVQSYAEVRSPVLACEVFLQPGNDVALLFHGMFGFNEVGQQVMPGLEQRVAMLTKEMCSWPWVNQTYYANGAGCLPDQPWLSPRALPVQEPARATGT